MTFIGPRQHELLQFCERYGPTRSLILWELMSMRYSETRISRMLDRLMELGLVDDQNAITELGRSFLTRHPRSGRS